MHWQFQRERAKSILGISIITYVTARPKSLGIVVLQFGEGFQVYGTREKTAEYYNLDDELYST